MNVHVESIALSGLHFPSWALLCQRIWCNGTDLSGTAPIYVTEKRGHFAAFVKIELGCKIKDRIKVKALPTVSFTNLGLGGYLQQSNCGPFLPGVTCRCAAAALKHQGKHELPMDNSTCSPPKAHGAIQESPAPPRKGFLSSLLNTLEKWKFRCAQGASCLAQLRLACHRRAAEECVQAMPHVAV